MKADIYEKHVAMAQNSARRTCRAGIYFIFSIALTGSGIAVAYLASSLKLTLLISSIGSILSGVGLILLGMQAAFLSLSHNCSESEADRLAKELSHEGDVSFWYRKKKTTTFDSGEDFAENDEKVSALQNLFPTFFSEPENQDLIEVLEYSQDDCRVTEVQVALPISATEGSNPVIETIIYEVDEDEVNETKTKELNQ